MGKIWEIYPRLTNVVLASHIEHNMAAGGHPFDHVLQAGQIAYIIAETEEIKRLGGAAALCHNADRILQKVLGVGKKDVPEAKVVEIMNCWFDQSGEFTIPERRKIIKPVLKHSGPNLDDGDEILVALQDADRIVCSMADCIMGAAQFWSEIRVIDPKTIVNSSESFRKPTSVTRDLLGRDDWVDPSSRFCVRLPKAKQLMSRRVAYIQNYLKEIREQREEIGLWPNYPFSESA